MPINLPEHVRVGATVYAVAIDDATLSAESLKMGGDLAGFSSHSTQQIALASGLGPDYLADTLLHEVLHSCLRAAGYDPNDDGRPGRDVEERTVKAMTGQLLGVLRANPDLVAFLIA